MPHLRPALRCRIYADRPPSCSDFACQWLTDPSMGPEWKPSVCKLVVDSKPRLLVVLADPAVSKPWRLEPYNAVLKRLAVRGPARGAPRDGNRAAALHRHPAGS